MATRPKKTQVVRLRVTEEELKFLRDEAMRQDRSVSSVLRVALRDYAAKATA